MEKNGEQGTPDKISPESSKSEKPSEIKELRIEKTTQDLVRKIFL